MTIMKQHKVTRKEQGRTCDQGLGAGLPLLPLSRPPPPLHQHGSSRELRISSCFEPQTPGGQIPPSSGDLALLPFHPGKCRVSETMSQEPGGGRCFASLCPVTLVEEYTQMMRLSHSGSSDCGSGCVSSMARTAVDYTADADTSLLPALPQEPASRTCSPTRKAQ